MRHTMSLRLFTVTFLLLGPVLNIDAAVPPKARRRQPSRSLRLLRQ